MVMVIFVPGSDFSSRNSNYTYDSTWTPWMILTQTACQVWLYRKVSPSQEQTNRGRVVDWDTSKVANQDCDNTCAGFKKSLKTKVMKINKQPKVDKSPECVPLKIRAIPHIDYMASYSWNKGNCLYFDMIMNYLLWW